MNIKEKNYLIEGNKDRNIITKGRITKYEKEKISMAPCNGHDSHKC